MIPKAIREALFDPKGKRKGKVPPHLKRFLFKKGHRKAGARKVLDPKSMPPRWFEAMTKGIMKSSDVGEGEARGHAHRIWRTLSLQDRKKATSTKRYDLPLPQDAHHSGGVIRVVKPFNLAEAQIDVTPKVFTALERTGVFQRMRRGDGTVGLVKRAKSNKGNVNIFIDRRR